MSRVFVSEDTGAAVYVFADDHCPPHVHARHRGDGWIARVRFSYVSRALELMSIAPMKNIPLQRVMNLLLDNIQERLSDCRHRWWVTNRRTCLTNQWALELADGTVTLLSKQTAGAKQIADACYEPTTGRLLVLFRDSTAKEVLT